MYIWCIIKLCNEHLCKCFFPSCRLWFNARCQFGQSPCSSFVPIVSSFSIGANLLAVFSIANLLRWSEGANFMMVVSVGVKPLLLLRFKVMFTFMYTYTLQDTRSVSNKHLNGRGVSLARSGFLSSYIMLVSVVYTWNILEYSVIHQSNKYNKVTFNIYSFPESLIHHTHRKTTDCRKTTDIFHWK